MKSTCTGCKLVFSGMTAFDKHRIGSYGDPIYQGNQTVGYTQHERRCMAIDEMLAAGLIEKDGIWGFPLDEKAKAYFERLKAVASER